MGLIEDMQSDLKKLMAKIQALETEVQALKGQRASGDKHALGKHLGKSPYWVNTRKDLPRYKVGNKYFYNFLKVDEYLEKCAKEARENIKGDWEK